MRTKSCCLLVGIAILMIIFGISQSYAQKVDLKARVGKYYFSISGYASPFASVVMKSNSVAIASTMANPEGNFLIEKVSVSEGFSEFCLEAIDIKKIGDTSSCFNIAPVTKDTKLANIFIPPTIALSAKKILPGSSVFASGYSMPNAEVILNISSDIVINTKAETSGYYKIEIKDLEPGKYSLFASAIYENRNSEKPDKRVELESLSLVGFILQNLIWIFLILLAVISMIILLFILLRRKLKEKIEKIKKLLGKKSLSRADKKPSHHSWFLGF